MQTELDAGFVETELDALSASMQSHAKELRARAHELRDMAHARMSDSAFLLRFVAVGCWFFVTSYINALGAVVAGHRTPRQPPLPDVAHELLPVEYIHQLLGATLVRFLPDYFCAFNIGCMLVYCAFEKRRWTILRRFLSIFGFVNLLRGFCVVATSLPDMSPHCSFQFDDMGVNGTGYYKTQPMFPRSFYR